MNLKMYRNGLTYCTLAAALVLNACKQGESAQPAKVISMEKLQSIAEGIDKPGVAAAEVQKAGAQFEALSFEEMEALIDLRYELNVSLGTVSAERATYLRNFRHQANRKAYELHKKPLQQLQTAQIDDVLAVVEGKTGTGGGQAARSGRVASDCSASSPLCTAWQATMGIRVSNDETPDRWMTAATYVGERTIQCSPTTYQTDCDYLFRYTFSKIWAPNFIKTNYGRLVIADPFQARLVDHNPSWIDCGTQTLQVVYGKKRIDFVYGSPTEAAANLQLGLSDSMETGWCYLGAWGSEKWYFAGVYDSRYDGWGRYNANPGYQVCVCDAYGKKVL